MAFPTLQDPGFQGSPPPFTSACKLANFFLKLNSVMPEQPVTINTYHISAFSQLLPLEQKLSRHIVCFYKLSNIIAISAVLPLPDRDAQLSCLMCLFSRCLLPGRYANATYLVSVCSVTQLCLTL